MQQIYPAQLFKRIVALGIDLLILYILGAFLTVVTGDLLLYLGNLKLLVGMVLATVYFTLGHSSLMKGQTLGKKIFGLRVVTLDGNYLNLPQAFFRALIFTIPYCLSNIKGIDRLNSLSIYQFLSYTLIPSLLFVNHYFIFTNPLRQCYYDLLLKTVVVGKDVTDDLPEYTPKPWFRFLPVIIIPVVLIAGIFLLEPFNSQNIEDNQELDEIKRGLKQNRTVYFSNIYYRYKANDNYNKQLKIECYIPQNQDISSELYLLTEELSPFKTTFGIKNINLSVVKDFNLGIYNSWEVLKKNEKLMKFDL